MFISEIQVNLKFMAQNGGIAIEESDSNALIVEISLEAATPTCKLCLCCFNDLVGFPNSVLECGELLLMEGIGKVES